MRRKTRRPAYPGYQGRRQRRHKWKPAVLLLDLLLLAAAAGAGALAYRYFHTPEKPPASPVSGPDEPEDPSAPRPLAERMTTPSGVACTRTDFGEEAIYAGDLILVNNWTAYHFPELERDWPAIYDGMTGCY